MQIHPRRSVLAATRFTPILPVLILFMLTGCATKPWQDTLSDDGRGPMLDVLEEIIERQAYRPRCFDADVTIFLTSYVKDRAASGYTQVMAPDTVKFVTSNPFGQPVFAFVGDQKNFQYVNTLNRTYLDGDINAFASIYEIPVEDFSGAWGDWLSGRIPENITDIVEMRVDYSEQGVWVEYAPPGEITPTATKHEHLLINTEQKMLVARTLTDHNGKIIARIDYFNRSAPPLSQPQTLKVSQLSYGAELEINFSNVLPMESCESQDFFIKRPAGYNYRRLTQAM